MLLIVGLGNIGAQYEGTYHNVGFSVADALAARLGLSFRENAGIRALEAEGNVGGKKIRILKPTTFMNLSGECVKSAMNKYKSQPSEVLIVLDEVDLPVGVTRLREKGSAGSHNGMKSVIENLQTESFLRVRMGIGRSDRPLIDYVLDKITPEDDKVFSERSYAVADLLIAFFRDGDEAKLMRNANILR